MIAFICKLFESLFCVAPFPEVPLHATLLRLYVKQVWMSLGTAGEMGKPLKIAIFGAGRHTSWLLQITRDCEKQPLVVATLDDSCQGKDFHGYPLVNLEDFDPASADLILLSSDTVSDRMEEKCRKLYGNNIQILNMYKELPVGPYYKDFTQFTEISDAS